LPAALPAALPAPVVPPAPFDPSGLRTQVQIGLQVRQGMPCSSDPREFQTLSSSNGIDDQSGILQEELLEDKANACHPSGDAYTAV